MKIAVTTTGPGMDGPVDERFGRARGFAIVENSDDEASIGFIENSQNYRASQGAGIQAAEIVAKAGAKVLLTGHVGPKAFRALASGGIEIYTGIHGCVRDALEDFKAGRLTKAAGADVEGHW